MNNESHNSKLLAKNTLILYVRMLFTVGISFYTARVILAGLGVSDYGLYNVIGGFVAMFYMVTSTLSGAVTRFLTFELGNKDWERLKLTFSTSVNIMLILSLFIIVIAETIGLWFVNNKLVIAPSRLEIANWLYQLSLLCFVIELINVPYNSSVISHEKMKAFAFVTVVNVLLKLGIALLIVYSPIDKLLFYGIMMALVSISTQLLYWVYCKYNFIECRYNFCFEWGLFRQMFVFAGWSFFSSISLLCSTQGINILLNMFFGTPINAARGMATHLDNTVKAFAKNFTIALTPQITKYYAMNDIEYTKKLICSGSKYSFFLLYIISFPVLLETDFVLNIWLQEVPPYCSQFLQLTMLCSMIEVLLNPFSTLNNATGDIKLYQIVVGGTQLLILPISYLALKSGAEPFFVLIVSLVVNLIIFFPRIYINKKYINIGFKDFTYEVLIKCIYVVIISVLINIPIISLLVSSWKRFVFVLFSSITSILLAIYVFGLNSDEKKMVNKYSKKYLKF